MTPEDRRFLEATLELARLGEGRTRPNPMVGSIVVSGGEVIGRGHHRRAGEEHAEIGAIAQAGKAAIGGTLYTNLEPCCHQGRTPPCVDRIIEAGIRRVVACTQDPNPLVDGRGFDLLRRAGIVVETGGLEAEAVRLNGGFFSLIRTGRPLVTVKAASSLDGRLSAAGGHSRWVTSPASREAAMRLRGRHDAVLVGIETVLADDPLLTVRPPAEERPVLRVVLDSMLRTPPECRLLATPSGGPVIIYHVTGAPAGRAEPLAARGAELVAAGPGPRPDIGRVLDDLGRREMLSLLVEGGGRVIGSFLSGGWAGRVCLFLSPTFLGAAGTPVLDGWSTDDCGRAMRLGKISTRRVGPDLFIEGVPVPVTRH